MARASDAERRDPHPVWRQKLEAFRRAGFEHLSARRLAPPELTLSLPDVAAAPIEAPPSTATKPGSAAPIPAASVPAPVSPAAPGARAKEAALAVIANEVAACQR